MYVCMYNWQVLFGWIMSCAIDKMKFWKIVLSMVGGNIIAFTLVMTSLSSVNQVHMYVCIYVRRLSYVGCMVVSSSPVLASLPIL